MSSSCNCFDHENRLCLASFHSHRDPEDEDGEERIVDPLRDLLINSEDEEDESDSDPDMLCESSNVFENFQRDKLNDCYGKTTLSKPLNRLRPSADLAPIYSHT